MFVDVLFYNKYCNNMRIVVVMMFCFVRGMVTVVWRKLQRAHSHF